MLVRVLVFLIALMAVVFIMTRVEEDKWSVHGTGTVIMPKPPEAKPFRWWSRDFMMYSRDTTYIPAPVICSDYWKWIVIDSEFIASVRGAVWMQGREKRYLVGYK